MKDLSPRSLLVTTAATVLLLVLTTVTTTPVTAQPAAAATGPQDPNAWAEQCGTEALGLGDDTVTRPPVLSGDRAANGKPVVNVPAATGHWYPVVMVHGWTSQDTVATATDRSGAFSHLVDLSSIPPYTAPTTRSLLGQLQGLPGAAVFTFDYHPYSARWVDDEHLGPALGKVIDCLYRVSGQRVVIVGHSMGGLVARWAATHPGVTGTDRSPEISTVVTFGTPETGSIAALLAETGLDLGAGTNEATAVIRLVLGACGQLASSEIKTGTLCDLLTAPIRTFESDAGIALRAGSPQLAALKPWPKGIVVDALAGDTSFEVPQAGWFHLPWATDKISGAGDMIVTKASALAGGTSTRSIRCDYQLDVIRGATDQIGLAFGLTASSQVARQPLGSFDGACFHTNLMRDIELTNDAVGAVNDAIVAARARDGDITTGDLSSFAGSYSSDTLEKAIVDSGFTLGGYEPKDYFHNATTVFPTIQKASDGWYYWSGAVHARYKLDAAHPPTETKGYYRVRFVGANNIAIVGHEITVTLVPPGVKGPDGSVSDENRIFSGANDQSSVREYHDDWWKNYGVEAPPLRTVIVPRDSVNGQFSSAGSTFTVVVWAQSETDDCASIVTGQLATYVASHYCGHARRILASTTIDGRPVALSIGYFDFGEPPGWTGNDADPPSYGYVSGFLSLAAQDGTGDLRSLLDNGHTFPGSGTSQPGSYGFDCEGEDGGAEIAEAWYLDGPSAENDPQLVDLAKSVFLQL